MNRGQSGRIEAARRGEAWAQEELVDQIRSLAQTICQSRSASATYGAFDWEDVAQDASDRLFEVGLDLYQGAGSERSYLYTIVKIAWLQALRSARRRSVREDAVRGPTESTPAQVNRTYVGRLLSRIDAPCGELVRAVFLEGVSYVELARELRLEVSSVRARASRCLSKLRQLAREEES